MANMMCVYRIKKEPYLAISKSYIQIRNYCLIRSTKGRFRFVQTLYQGPFDLFKVCMFGSLVGAYFQKDNNISISTVIKKCCDLFHIDHNLLFTV